jgi:hypothetical protein
MSIRKVSERIKEQNELLIAMAGNEDANSTLMRQSLDEMKSVLSGIHKVLLDQEKEEGTEESREKLQDKDKEEERKSLFSGFLGQREGGKKESKGMLGMIGKIFTKALGFLVKSLPLIGLASLFFGDVVTGLLTAAIGDYDQASILKNILAGGLIGSIFGFRGALIGAIVGFLFSEETWSGLKDRWDAIIASFNEQDWAGMLSNIGSFIGALGGIGAAIVGLVATIIGPLTTLALAKKLFTRGGRPPVGGPMGPPLPPGPAPNPGQRQPAPRSQGRIGRALGGLRGLGGRAVGRLGSALVMTPMLASVGASAVKDVISTGARTAGSAIKSGASTAAAATGSVAKTVGKKATLGAVAKAIPGLSILAGVGFGLNALKNGDPVAAGLHIASGIVGTVPGLGTAASLTLTGAAAARESGALGGGDSDIKVEVNGKSESLSEATRERDELVAKTSSNVIMDNSTTNNVSSGGGGGVSISSPISFFDSLDPYNSARV